MNIREAISKLVLLQNLDELGMQEVMREIMTGEATEAQVGAFLVALRMKGETIEEIVGAARVMRSLVTPVSIDLDGVVDTCGTGGDGANLFNVSTASAFVVAAAGVKVAKHGNRSVSSSCGSADVLEAAGANLTLGALQVARSVEQVGVGFMFAPAHHGAMKHAIGPRRELGLRTIYNILGPMANPAGVKRQVLGVFDRDLCKPLAQVLQRLGSEHVLVVHAADGLDELSVAASSFVAELKSGVVTEYELSPAEFGLACDSLEGLSVTSSKQSLALIRDVFSRANSVVAGKAANIIALNAGAAIYVSGAAVSFGDGVAMAEDAIASGAADEKLKEFVEFSNAAS